MKTHTTVPLVRKKHKLVSLPCRCQALGTASHDLVSHFISKHSHTQGTVDSRSPHHNLQTLLETPALCDTYCPTDHMSHAWPRNAVSASITHKAALWLRSGPFLLGQLLIAKPSLLRYTEVHGTIPSKQCWYRRGQTTQLLSILQPPPRL
jgi:hypothetical protein